MEALVKRDDLPGQSVVMSRICSIYRLIPVLFFLLLISDSHRSSVNALSVPRRPEQIRQVTIQMKGYSPDVEDDYVAIWQVAQPGFIVRFEPFAQADRVHHILVYGCDYPARDDPLWKGGETCRGAAHILYAWAKNAPDLHLPDGVAFSVGHETDSIRYFVLQMHYSKPFAGHVLDYSGVTLHMIDNRPAYLAAVLLFVSGSPIPPGFAHYQTNMSCTYKGVTQLHPFAFRTHTHGMGRVVSAFFKNSTGWFKIGKRNPQWPQLFQSAEPALSIGSGDIMAATCVFDSSQQKEVMQMGNTGHNEMCNFYMMFYWDSTVPDPFPLGAVCPVHQAEAIVNKEYPIDGTTLLPPHPDLEHEAHQMGRPFGVTESFVATSIGGITLGMVSAIAFDPYGNLVVFHRAGRNWDQNSFDYSNNLINQSAIGSETVLVAKLNEKGTGVELVAKYGAGQFYMPHGLYVDSNNDYFTTDVGSHQVIKWRVMNGHIEQIFALGERFVPGSDSSHFCKPAGVVTTPDGSIFVSDGYCNSRIMKFDSSGKYLTEWGQPYYSSLAASSGDGVPSLGLFSIPHDISAHPDGSLVYVSDRENAVVQIFRANGQPVGQIGNPGNTTAFTSVYSAHYFDGSVYLISGLEHNIPLRAFSAHASSARVQFSFEPTSYHFTRPHTIRASPDGQFIYVGEQGADGSGRLCQFVYQRESTRNPVLGSSGSSASEFAASVVGSSASSALTAVGALATAILIALLAIFYVFRSKGLRRIGPQQSVLDRAGFKPLRTDDPSSDEDSEDDTIVSRKKLNHRF